MSITEEEFIKHLTIKDKDGNARPLTLWPRQKKFLQKLRENRGLLDGKVILKRRTQNGY